MRKVQCVSRVVHERHVWEHEGRTVECPGMVPWPDEDDPQRAAFPAEGQVVIPVGEAVGERREIRGAVFEKPPVTWGWRIWPTTKFKVARWFVGLRIGPFSLFLGWINMRSARNYNRWLADEGVPL